LKGEQQSSIAAAAVGMTLVIMHVASFELCLFNQHDAPAVI
jgi:hypothetical protein